MVFGLRIGKFSGTPISPQADQNKKKELMQLSSLILFTEIRIITAFED